MKDYNEDKDVWYCQSCLSLRIVNLSDDEMIPCYCDKCTSTDIGVISIENWESLYEGRYGKKYISKKK